MKIVSTSKIKESVLYTETPLIKAELKNGDSLFAHAVYYFSATSKYLGTSASKWINDQRQYSNQKNG